MLEYDSYLPNGNEPDWIKTMTFVGLIQIKKFTNEIHHYCRRSFYRC